MVSIVPSKWDEQRDPLNNDCFIPHSYVEFVLLKSCFSCRPPFFLNFDKTSLSLITIIFSEDNWEGGNINAVEMLPSLSPKCFSRAWWRKKSSHKEQSRVPYFPIEESVTTLSSWKVPTTDMRLQPAGLLLFELITWPPSVLLLRDKEEILQLDWNILL